VAGGDLFLGRSGLFQDLAVALGLGQAVAFPQFVVGVELLQEIHQAVQRAHGERAGAAGGIEDGLARFRLQQLHHEADDVARRAELAVLARFLHLFEQIFKDVPHDVGVDRTGIELAEELIDEADRPFEGLGLVDVENEIGVAEAARDPAKVGVAVLSGVDALFQAAQPREHGFIEQRKGRVLPDVGPAAFFEIGVLGIGRALCVDGGFNGLDPGPVESFQLPDEEQVGDLFDGDERV